MNVFDLVTPEDINRRNAVKDQLFSAMKAYEAGQVERARTITLSIQASLETDLRLIEVAKAQAEHALMRREIKASDIMVPGYLEAE